MAMKKFMSIFMISLIISLPIYSAAVFAQIFRVSGHGSDEIPGIVRDQSDTLSFSTLVSGDNINPDQVELFGTGAGTGIQFTECSPANNVFSCQLNDIDLSDLQICESGESQNRISLYSIEGELIDSKIARIACDSTPPSGQLSTDRILVGANQTVKFIYEVRDFSDFDNNIQCAGIQSITLTAGEYSREELLVSDLCVVRGEISELGENLPHGDHQFRLEITDRLGNTGSSDSTDLQIDVQPPIITIKDFSITDQFEEDIEFFSQQQAKLNFDINVQDETEAVFEADLSSVGAGTLAPNSCTAIEEGQRTCSWQGIEFLLNSSEFNADIPLTATDLAGNSETATITLSATLPVDSTPPAFSNFVVTEVIANNVSRYIKEDSYDMNFEVEVSDLESGVVANSVRANMSGLSASYSLKIPSFACAESGNKTVCAWNGVNVKLDDSKTSAAITFEAVDRVGNKGSSSVTYAIPFTKDTTGPVVTDLSTARTDGSRSYANPIENTFVAAITEEGAGMKKADVFLDLSNLGGNANIKANNCTSGWECSWENVGLGDQTKTGTAIVKAESKDDLGNQMEEAKFFDIFVDADKPVVNDIKVIAVSASRPAIPGLIQTGNALLIEANLSENLSLTGMADLSSIITGLNRTVPDACDQEGNNWTCTWITPEIDKEGPLNEFMIFNFTDFAGNSRSHRESVKILKASETEADFWEVEVGVPSPRGIDKQLITFRDPFVWFPVSLKSKEGFGPQKRWPVSVEIDQCLNIEEESFAELISSANNNLPEFTNFNSLEADELPYLMHFKFVMDRAIPLVDDLPIICQLKITTLVDNREISLPEVENFTVEIPYFNNELGTLHESVENEIEAVKNNWLVEAKWIQSVKNLIDLAGTICRSIFTLVNVLNILAAIKDIFGAQCATGILGFMCPASKAAGEGTTFVKGSLESLYTGASKYCAYFSSRAPWCNAKEPDDKEGSDIEETQEEVGRLEQEAKDTFLAQQDVVEKQVSGRENTGYFGNVDPERSLLLSVACLSPRGIVYNLQKARAIECQYIQCLKNTREGYPVQLCAAQHGYSACKYVYGEIFNAIPFAAAISRIGQNVLRIVSHPLEAIGWGIDLGCRQLTCEAPAGFGCWACTIVEFFDVASSVACDLGIGAGRGCEPFWQELNVDDQICDIALADDEDEGLY